MMNEEGQVYVLKYILTAIKPMFPFTVYKSGTFEMEPFFFLWKQHLVVCKYMTELTEDFSSKTLITLCHNNYLVFVLEH